MSFRSFFAVAVFAVVAGTVTVTAPAAAEPAPSTRSESCNAFKVSTISSNNVFKAQGTLESTVSQNAAIPFPEIKICCYKYLGCFLCIGGSTTTR